MVLSVRECLKLTTAAVCYAALSTLLGPEVLVLNPFFFPFSVVSRGRNCIFPMTQATVVWLSYQVSVSLCSNYFSDQIYDRRLLDSANIKAPQMCVTSSDTGLRDANINTIYQMTIVSHQDKGGWWWRRWW